MKMSVLLLLVTAIGMLVPSEAQAKRYRVDRTGRNSWTVTDEAELLDDPDRFAFGADPELLRKWGIDPEEVCKTPPGRSTGLGREDSSTLPTSEGRCPRTILEERSDTWKEGGDPLQPDSCRWINNTWQSFNLTDLRRQLADRIKSGRDPGCDSMVGMVEALEHVAPPSNPVLQKKRADLENCLESRRRSLAAKIKEKEDRCPAKVAAYAEVKRNFAAKIEAENKRCAAKAAAKTERERRIVADNEKCKTDLAARIQERIETAPTRPIAEILEIPERYRLAQENARLADEKAKKITQGKRKPKTAKTSTQETSAPEAK